MKKLGLLLMMTVGLGMSFQSCDDSKTYAELKEEEREAIKRYIELNNIKVIDEKQPSLFSAFFSAFFSCLFFHQLQHLIKGHDVIPPPGIRID